ncbi:MAG: penicillin-insensitive murein endopeptidase, partial [Enhygromyxa sp.]
MALLATMLAALLASEPAAVLRLPEGANPNEYVQATWFAAVVSEPIAVPAWQAHWRGDETELLDTPRWIRHLTGPRETLDDIAARYGTDAAHLREWNPKSLAERRRFVREGIELRLKAIRIPPPREPIDYTVEEGDSWETIAVDHRVDVLDLKSYNRAASEDSVEPLEPGRAVTVWIDPAVPWTVNRKVGPEPDPAWFDIPPDALSHGHPNRGRITGEPCLLPDIPQLYTRRFERIAHGSSHAIEVIVTAFANFRRDTGYEGEILVGSISRPHGRRFPPHRSHQSGRDVDIRVPMLPWFPTTINPPAEQIDWRAVWGLIDAFLATGQVEMIFLDHALQRPLYYAALSMGASVEELEEIITWPRRDGKKGKKIIRHSKGHEGHIHVRIRCGEDEPACRTR